MLDPNKLKKSNAYQVRAELDMAKDLLSKSISVARANLVPSVKGKGNKQSYEESVTTIRSRQSALIILLLSFDALSLLEMKKQELEDSKDPYNSRAESALRGCISTYKERIIISGVEFKVRLFGRSVRVRFRHRAVIVEVNVTPALAEEVSTPATTGSDGVDIEISGLRKIEDGSVVSNIHTSKWRVFADSGRDLFLQGKLEEAEKLFLSALQEAKEGFGDRAPHVASAYNNLAELYRVKNAFDKAEPMYLEAIIILEESFGQEDVRVAAILHNLGQFYLMQRKLEQARGVYERALKIKRRVLGEAHPNYADTMYDLGTVLYLQGKYKDSEALIRDSIRILEDGGQGESMICTKRMQQLAEIYIKSDQIEEAENVLRKILHIMELPKGWNSLETVIAAERLALTLQSLGNLKEAQELLKRCLDARRALLPENDIQIAANLLYLARVTMLDSNKLKKSNAYQVRAELDMAKDLLSKSISVARANLVPSVKGKGNKQSYEESVTTVRSRQSALIILLLSFDVLSLLEMKTLELEDSKDPYNSRAVSALHGCISAYKEFITKESLSDVPGVKAEYLLCLRRLVDLLSDSRTTSKEDRSSNAALQELKDEIKRVDVELSLEERRP